MQQTAGGNAMAFDGVEIGFAVPVLGLSAKSKWRPDPAAKDAAWAIYVEMATRIAIAELSEGHLPRGDHVLSQAVRRGPRHPLPGRAVPLRPEGVPTSRRWRRSCCGC
jgi:hypothetical protein